jgi:hypothetical protein
MAPPSRASETVSRDLGLYLGAWFLENLGAQMLGIAVGWQVYALTHRALDLGYVGLAQLAPAIGAAAMAMMLAYRPLIRRAGPILLLLSDTRMSP